MLNRDNIVRKSGIYIFYYVFVIKIKFILYYDKFKYILCFNICNVLWMLLMYKNYMLIVLLSYICIYFRSYFKLVGEIYFCFFSYKIIF